jgi:hypothetical protein
MFCFHYTILLRRSYNASGEIKIVNINIERHCNSLLNTQITHYPKLHRSKANMDVPTAFISYNNGNLVNITYTLTRLFN